ncbi:MAG: YkgJ family cysteine cluster protein [Desulfovibrionaceae bacterium]|nr:YkgJ family cysteine cluster protein [Desulfovibrionaceae bacterium]
MSCLRLFTGLFRRFRSMVLRRPVRLAGQCALCGGCCRNILLMYEGKWLRRPGQYRAMLEHLPNYARFEHAGYDDYGFMIFTCNRLGEDNLCSDYEGRPPLCRNYPSESIYYQGGRLRRDCGYTFEAVTFRDAILRRLGRRPDFAQELGKELHRADNGRKKKEDGQP